MLNQAGSGVIRFPANAGKFGFGVHDSKVDGMGKPVWEGRAKMKMEMKQADEGPGT